MDNGVTKFKHIGYIKTDFKEKFGIPRQSGRSKSSVGRIIFYPEYRSPDAIRKIEGFSHLWLLFDFSLSHTTKWQPTVRPPRLGGNEKVGVFASRSPFRPNPIGLSSVKLVGIEKTNEGNTLLVSGVDLLDGTPIFDIKPYLPSTDCHTDAIGGYADQFTQYKLSVEFDENLKGLIPQDKLNSLIECLSDDPRPSYIDDEREYGLKFDQFNIKFIVKENTLTVTKVEKIN